MSVRAGASAVKVTIILVGISIIIAICVAFWATCLLESFGKGGRITVLGVVKKADREYIMITRGGERYVLVGPEPVLDALAALPAEVEVRGILIRENATLRLESACWAA